MRDGDKATAARKSVMSSPTRGSVMRSASQASAAKSNSSSETANEEEVKEEPSIFTELDRNKIVTAKQMTLRQRDH